MELLAELGINSSIWAHLGVFLITYLCLSNLLFKPYLAAYDRRTQMTQGNEDEAVSINEKTDHLLGEYEIKARALNKKVRAFYNDAQTEALKVQKETLENAKKEADKRVQQAREEVGAQVEKARNELNVQVGTLSQNIAQKVLGKEL